MNQGDHYSDYAQPISQMRAWTANNTPFKVVFRKKDGSMRLVNRALLRKQSIGANDRTSAYKIQLLDLDQDKPRSAYIPLLISVNDKKIIL
ncbi:hypothetical protein L0P88_03985 [Muricauda sp. SCSIO 64092]|uniref:hypothetical protein n=1 Tax=Allomuricauda sp. SCSIO 64092 TaxID=2908842 RepID=UPI001FF49E14|nr:hypothetical protein [Muricauda sp. SCSIO 64092]UOY07714.1 hypothetical protein L0P88_03985 [Muricauda sp. SCSIO 64092]